MVGIRVRVDTLRDARLFSSGTERDTRQAFPRAGRRSMIVDHTMPLLWPDGKRFPSHRRIV
jgi:hypothetical protein